MKRRVLILFFGAIILCTSLAVHDHNTYAPNSHQHGTTIECASIGFAPQVSKIGQGSAKYLITATETLSLAKSHSQHYTIFTSSLSLCKSVMTHMIFRVFRI